MSESSNSAKTWPLSAQHDTQSTKKNLILKEQQGDIVSWGFKGCISCLSLHMLPQNSMFITTIMLSFTISRIWGKIGGQFQLGVLYSCPCMGAGGRWVSSWSSWGWRVISVSMLPQVFSLWYPSMDQPGLPHIIVDSEQLGWFHASLVIQFKSSRKPSRSCTTFMTYTWKSHTDLLNYSLG